MNTRLSQNRAQVSRAHSTTCHKDNLGVRSGYAFLPSLFVPALDFTVKAGGNLLHLLADGLPAGVPIFDNCV